MKIKLLMAISILIIIIAVFTSFGFTSNLSEINKYYIVYYNGEILGNIESSDELNKIINYNNKLLMEKYDTEKIYNPDGIEINEYYGRNLDIITEEKMYEIIESKSAFTILGYKLKVISEESTFYLYSNKKEYLVNAINDTVITYINEKDLEKYRENLEVIKENGKIELMGIKEDIYIYEELIPTDKDIYTNQSDISKLMLYQTLEEQEIYTVQDGDNIEIVAEKNKMNDKEFLIANPKYTSKNNLLVVGEVVNVGLTNPIFTSYVEEYNEIERNENYQTEIQYDSNKPKGHTEVLIEGVDGLNLVKEKHRYENGQLVAANVLSVEVLKPAVKKVIVQGTKVTNVIGTNPGGYEHIVGSSDNFAWPAPSYTIITSYYGYRWGRLHGGIDIAFSKGTPIYTITGGTVEVAKGGCYDGNSTCNGGFGNHVIINHNNGLVTTYAHLNSIDVLIGQGVSRGQQIGTMGNTGRSTGVHLHFETKVNGTRVNPCDVLRC